MMVKTDMTKIWGEEMTEEEIEEMSRALGYCEVCGGKGEICVPAYVVKGEIKEEECFPCHACQKVKRAYRIKNNIKRLLK